MISSLGCSERDRTAIASGSYSRPKCTLLYLDSRLTNLRCTVVLPKRTIDAYKKGIVPSGGDDDDPCHGTHLDLVM